jgi:hypothetical protein
MKNATSMLIVALAAVLFFVIQTPDLDAVQTSREKACGNPRDPGEQDPKFCAHLTVVKNVQGGTASPSEFTISVTGNNQLHFKVLLQAILLH